MVALVETEPEAEAVVCVTGDPADDEFVKLLLVSEVVDDVTDPKGAVLLELI